MSSVPESRDRLRKLFMSVFLSGVLDFFCVCVCFFCFVLLCLFVSLMGICWVTETEDL